MTCTFGMVARLRRRRATAGKAVVAGRVCSQARQAGHGWRGRRPLVEADPMADRHLPPRWLRSQSMSLVLCTLVVIAYGSSTFLSLPKGYHEFLVAVFTGTLALLM